MADWADWIGKSETRHDVITPGLLQRFCATIDQPVTDDIPQGLHWCLCLPDTPTAELAEDGHPAKGGFLPPIPLPRRMWASSSVSFDCPLQRGDEITRVSTVASIDEKSGKSGDLVFVAVDRETRVGELVAIRERQNIVYREPATIAEPAILPSNETPDLSDWAWQQTILPTEPLLFRYSALTFNSHRIHYDRPYAMQDEGYPGLVVQGPLMATMLLNLAASELGANRLSSFSFRGQAPAFANAAIYLVGKPEGETMTLAVIGHDGKEVMSAQARI
ncbi:FAS1-like dehydratase domain-containing protein [Sphingorhabdus sp. 109]|jgi:3-methylfumaryl-CoA hydratase|uniref:FAS1-like dehydratase domain-containing protein n=1 Tax=Sphingorhabdus sp. 109 TaxID=2653173 RepID=UPI0012F249FD|nr:MaoC family dehydratase N-terminal domain-containing protein [Sphingorhabdus sp. 109]VWX56330.1 Mesaconyl-C(4)-CoA hydratase [Sphingorhabdus sp. 109]